jgi:iron complex transport system ATP-binding protein
MALLALENVTVRFGARLALRSVDLAVERGECVALLGPNGAGKTTLLRVGLGLLPASGGRVTLDGADGARLRPRERAARVAWLPQVPRYVEPIGVLECVAAARFRFSEPRRIALARAEEMLEQLDLASLKGRPISELSGGEQQRVALAAVLAQETPLVLLDEPANHLDPARQAETYAWLGRMVAGGKSLVCVTHDVNLVRHLRAAAPGAPLRVVGLRQGAKAFESGLDSDELADALGKLFGVPFEGVPVEPGPAFLARSGRPSPA